MNKLMMVLVSACAANAFAMPTKDELKKAQPLVAELMADDIAAFKAKTKKPAEVGEMSVKYAGEASTEAAKFLLLKGAISYFIRGEAYDRAADAVNALRTAIPDLPPSVLEEIIRKDTARVTAKKAPRLYAQYTMAQTQVTALKTVNTTKTALAKKPNDPALSKRLAEAYALAGDWKSALETFPKLTTDAAKIAKDESAGKNRPAAADFWWNYTSYAGNDDADVFKIHAAELYRQALAAGEIDGLKKNIVEKRIKQFDGNDCTVIAKAKPEPRSDKVVPAAYQSAKDKKQGKPISIKINNRTSIEFVNCPPGKFTMGRSADKDDLQYLHDVNITRQFWMSKFPVTIEQFDAFSPVDDEFTNRQGPQGKPNSPVCLSISKVDEFCAWMNRRFRNSLPRNCVFRLPTDAEWEYALFACSTDVNDPYIRFRDGEKSAAREIWGDAVPVVPVGTSGKPNAWGLYDMLGNGTHYVLDTISSAYVDNQHQYGRVKNLECNYQDEESDPLRLFIAEGNDKNVARHLMRGGRYYANPSGPNLYHRMVECGGVNRHSTAMKWTFRLVIGPDLVGEWKAKHGKK